MKIITFSYIPTNFFFFFLLLPGIYYYYYYYRPHYIMKKNTFIQRTCRVYNNVPVRCRIHNVPTYIVYIISVSIRILMYYSHRVIIIWCGSGVIVVEAHIVCVCVCILYCVNYK